MPRADDDGMSGEVESSELRSTGAVVRRFRFRADSVWPRPLGAAADAAQANHEPAGPGHGDTGGRLLQRSPPQEAPPHGPWWDGSPLGARGRDPSYRSSWRAPQPPKVRTHQ